MAKGGARARSGPPPDPDSLTQADGEWTVLPASGRVGEVPPWPLDDAQERELDLWADEWSRPQAIMWDKLGAEIEVAIYVRSLVKAEQHDAPTSARTLLRQLQESLGLSMPGLLRNRWRIGEPVPSAPAAQGRSPSSRDRLRVVGGGD